MLRILIIQTAFTGDVILATALAEKLWRKYEKPQIDFLVKKNNEKLFDGHPFVKNVHVFDKSKNKLLHLTRLIRKVRAEKYDAVINLHRFASSGLITALSGALIRSGFDKNPLAFAYKEKHPHLIQKGVHETERNQRLIASLTDNIAVRPKLYPTDKDFEVASAFVSNQSFICIFPASVWHTKQYPEDGWINFMNRVPETTSVILAGGPDDLALCERIKENSTHQSVHIAAGKFSLLESAALMSKAKMNFSNDSAPLHLATAMNAPITALYCSTVPAFGFAPLSNESHIVQYEEPLACRPCGLHGRSACPEGHFMCAKGIKTEQLLQCMG